MARHCGICGKTGHDRRRHRRSNPEFFTDYRGVHPIRGSYSKATGAPSSGGYRRDLAGDPLRIGGGRRRKKK